MTSHADEPSERGGRYAIGGEIGVGGMASVRIGMIRGAAGFSRVVAIKRLHPHLAQERELLDMLLDEAHLAARVHHPNVVPVLDTFFENGDLHVVMEYVHGVALCELAPLGNKAQRAPLPVAVAIIADALTGLGAAHLASSEDGTPLGIIHRDVSPQNLLVGVDGVTRVTDFGIARAFGRITSTRHRELKGKAAYMAPEQVEGGTIHATVDLWAIGVVLWELLTGRRLFRGETDAEVFEQIRAAAVSPPGSIVPELSQALDAFVLGALAGDPHARPASAAAMAATLLELTPRASAADVGAWVAEVARETLTRRAALIAQLPSPSADDRRVASRSERVPAGKPSTERVPAALPGRSRRVMVLAGVPLFVLISIGLGWAIAKDRATTRAPSASTSSTPDHAAQPASSTRSSASLEAVPPTSAAPSSIRPEPPAASRSASAAPRAAASPSAGSHVPPAPIDCDPPYILDSIGRKIYRRECL